MELHNLPIHFDNSQGKHEISTDSLITFVEAYKNIAKILGLKIKIQIDVPEEGGWKTNLIIIVVSFIGPNPPSILFTGKTVDDWAKEGHKHIADFITQKAEDSPDVFPPDVFPPDVFPRACIKNKNNIYKQFLKDDCIAAFHLGDYPPIPRRSFHLYIKELDEESSLYLGETDITVHSPDWKGKRTWRGKIKIISDEDCSFDFDKDLTGKFWEKVRLDKLPLHTNDTMRVQLIERPTHKVKYSVIRVLIYNDQEIDSAISEEDIMKFSKLNTQENVAESGQLEIPFD